VNGTGTSTSGVGAGKPGCEKPAPAGRVRVKCCGVVHREADSSPRKQGLKSTTSGARAQEADLRRVCVRAALRKPIGLGFIRRVSERPASTELSGQIPDDPQPERSHARVPFGLQTCNSHSRCRLRPGGVRGAARCAIAVGSIVDAGAGCRAERRLRGGAVPCRQQSGRVLACQGERQCPRLVGCREPEQSPWDSGLPVQAGLAGRRPRSASALRRQPELQRQGRQCLASVDRPLGQELPPIRHAFPGRPLHYGPARANSSGQMASPDGHVGLERGDTPVRGRPTGRQARLHLRAEAAGGHSSARRGRSRTGAGVGGLSGSRHSRPRPDGR